MGLLASLSACATGAWRVDWDRVSDTLADIDAVQLSNYAVYYQGSKAHPNAVLLEDTRDSLRFDGHDWTRADQQQAPVLLRAARSAGLRTARLRDGNDRQFGYLLAEPYPDRHTRNRYLISLHHSPNPGEYYRVIRRTTRLGDSGGGQ
jgi:hypothetical protein